MGKRSGGRLNCRASNPALAELEPRIDHEFGLGVGLEIDLGLDRHKSAGSDHQENDLALGLERLRYTLVHLETRVLDVGD